MTRPPRTGFVSVSAQGGQYDAASRREWLLLLAKAREIAGPASSGRSFDRFEASGLAGLVIRMRRPFPVAGVSAAAAAEAFLVLARAGVAAGWPRALAGFALAGAAALETLLTEDAHRHAAISRRQMGEADEE